MEAKAAGISPGDGHLLDEVDIIQEELDAQEEIEGHVRLLLPGVVLPSLGSHFGQFGIGVHEEKLIVCKFVFFCGLRVRWTKRERKKIINQKKTVLTQKRCLKCDT